MAGRLGLKSSFGQLSKLEAMIFACSLAIFVPLLPEGIIFRIEAPQRLRRRWGLAPEMGLASRAVCGSQMATGKPLVVAM